MKKASIEYGKYFHIYNRGNNYENIFLSTEHYEHFLKLYEIYIEPIAETFAWCLMKNHFHTLVRIKEEHEIGYLNSVNAKEDDKALKWKTYFPAKPNKNLVKKPNPQKMFQHLFNAYVRWFNLKTGRINTLLSREFERKLVDNQQYYKNLIVYINNNPVHHGFVEHPMEYSRSSCNSIISTKPTNLKRDEIIGYFNDLGNYKYMHTKLQDYNIIEKYIIE